MRMMNSSIFSRAFEKIIIGLNVTATFWVFMMVMFVVLDVGGRLFFKTPLTGTPEIIRLSNPMIVFLQITYVLWIGRHIRTDILLDRMSRKGSAFINILNALMGIFIFALNFYSGWSLTVAAFSEWEYEGEGALRVPVGPVRLIILIGSVLMIIQFFRIIFTNFSLLVKTSSQR